MKKKCRVYYDIILYSNRDEAELYRAWLQLRAFCRPYISFCLFYLPIPAVWSGLVWPGLGVCV